MQVGGSRLHLRGIDEGQVIDEFLAPLVILEIAFLASFGEVSHFLLPLLAGFCLDAIALLEFGPEGDDGFEC